MKCEYTRAHIYPVIHKVGCPFILRTSQRNVLATIIIQLKAAEISQIVGTNDFTYDLRISMNDLSIATQASSSERDVSSRMIIFYNKGLNYKFNGSISSYKTAINQEASFKWMTNKR